MPQFKYTAINAQGKKIKDTLQSTSHDEVVNYLTSRQLVAVEVTELSTKNGGSKNLKTNEKIYFTQNISVLLSSGISLGESLSIIANDTTNKQSASFYESIRVDLEQGTPLSKALSKYPKTFDSIYISLIEAGENSGELASVMENLAKGIEKDARTLHQIKSAMVYPALVLGTLVVMGIGIIFFVLPKITEVFTSLNVDLPFVTQLLVSFGGFVNKQPLLTVAALVFVIIALSVLSRIPSLRTAAIRGTMKLPLIRDLVRHLDLTRLSSTLSLLLGAGVPIQNALKIASGTIVNPRLSHEFSEVSTKLSSGIALGQALYQTDLPKTFVALVSVGERSGKIASIFNTLAEHYEELFDTSVKNFTGAIEPVMTLFVGVMVGGAVVTIMLPIYQFMGNLQAGIK